MSYFSLNKQSDTRYFIEGQITFASLNKATIPSFEFLKSAKKIDLDLEKVTAADSAGLALILELIKYSKLYNTKLNFKNTPQQLLTLAALSELDLNDYLANDTTNLRLD